MRVENKKYSSEYAVAWLLSIIAFTLISCSSGESLSVEEKSHPETTVPVTVIHAPWIDGYGGFATEERIFTYGSGDEESLNKTITHENGHLEQIHEAGGDIPFWITYAFNHLQACEWEMETGLTEHFICEQQSLALDPLP